MYINKLLKKLLMAATLLALLFSAACASKNEIQSTDGQALVEQGEAYMTCMKESDFNCAYALLSPSEQKQIDQAVKEASEVVDLERLIESLFKTSELAIAGWTFDRAQFSTRDGKTIGSLEGKVQFVDGKRGKISLEFENSDGTWKLQASDLHFHTGISLGLGK